MSDSIKPSTPVKSVSLISGSDGKVAAELKKGFQASQKAGRVIMAFGLFAWEVKEQQLKHGQWGNWLMAHCPELCRKDKKTGELIPKPLSAVNTYMGMTKDVLEDMGFTIEKWFKHLSNSHGVGICHGGKFLLAPPKKLTKEAAELKQQICDRVDGKTVKQIRLGFSQVEEDEETGELKTKRGARKGSKGCTKEMRAAAKAAKRAAELLELKLRLKELGHELDALADDKHAGDPEVGDDLNKLFPKVENFFRYTQSIREARKGK